jgi:hypothetical protein
MLLRNKPLEIVDELKIVLLLMQAARRASRPRRWDSNIAMDSDRLIFMRGKREGRLLQSPPVKKFCELGNVM